MAGWSVRTRALVCPICGARLRWDAEAPIIECGYCHTHVVVETGRVTDQPTTTIADAHKRRRVPWLVAGSVLVLLAGTFVYLIIPVGPPPPGSGEATPTSTVAQLIDTPLATTATEVAARHGVAVTGRQVRIQLADGAFSEARLAWSEDAAGHVSEISLTPRNAGDLPGIVERVREQLGRRRLRQTARDSYQFGAKGVWLHVSTTVTIGVTDRARADTNWQDRLSQMWTVVKGAALGTPDRISAGALRDMFNLAYTVNDLGAIGFDVVIEDAAGEVHRAAPAADSDGARHTIGLEHPWLDSAVLQWQNAPRGMWTNLTLYLHADRGLSTASEPLIDCLRGVLGEPKRLVSDHAKGTFTLQYPARGGRPWVDVGEITIQIYPHYTFGEPATADGLRAVLTTLAGCGG